MCWYLAVSDGDEGGKGRGCRETGARQVFFTKDARARINSGVGCGRKKVGHLQKAVSIFAAGPTQETLRPGLGREILRDLQQKEGEKSHRRSLILFFNPTRPSPTPRPTPTTPSRRQNGPVWLPLPLISCWMVPSLRGGTMADCVVLSLKAMITQFEQ